jgi:hypothetical protein
MRGSKGRETPRRDGNLTQNKTVGNQNPESKTPEGLPSGVHLCRFMHGLVLSEPSELKHDQDGADESDRGTHCEHIQSQSQVHLRPPRLNRR